MSIHIIPAVFTAYRTTTTKPRNQWDYGQVLNISGQIDLPEAFEAHFCCEGDHTTVTQIGQNGLVEVPYEYMETGRTVLCFIFLHDASTDGRTMYTIRIPILRRPRPTDLEPTPVQHDAITEAIGAMQAARADIESLAEDAHEAIEDAFEEARQRGEFKGDKGDKGDTGAQGEKGDKGDPGDVSLEQYYGVFPTDTASGSIASFSDGADDIPMKSVKVAIEPVQDLHGQDAPYPAGGRINLLKATQYGGTYAGAIGYDLKQNDPMEYVITPDGRFEINVINAWRYRMFATDVFSAGTYTARTYGNSSAIRASIYITDSNLVVKSVIYNQSSAGWGPVQTATLDDGDRIAICIGANAVGKYITEFQVNSGDTIKAIVPFENICPISGWTGAQVSHSGADRTNPTTYSVTFPSEAGTVYGGTLDVTNGTLTVDRAFIASYNGETLPSEWISDRDKYVAGTTPTTGAQVCYELATPITYTLTPTEIKSLLGENNVWADAGDTEVTYRADTAKYIDKKIAEVINALS